MTPRFRRLWYADVVSVVGDALTSTTMLLWVYWVGHHRAVWVSASVLAGYLPRVLAGPLLGGLADRVDRRRLMMATDVIRVVVALTVAFAVHMRQPVPALVGLALMAAAGQVFGSAQQALI